MRGIILDVKPWMIIGIMLGLVIGFDHPDAPAMLLITLMIQMTLALQGLKFDFSDIKNSRKGVIACFLFCFVMNTGITLLSGLLFIDDKALWYGWVMLSAVPCAISVITMTFYMKGDLKLGMLAFSCIYVGALILTPLITHILMGEAASWFKILQYVLMFVVIPFLVNIPFSKVQIPPRIKIIVLNIIIMIMVFISVGFRRDYIIENPDIALLLLLTNIVRIFVPSLLLLYILKRIGCDRDKGIVYIAIGTWRNSGLAATLCIVMFSSTFPEALLPAVLSLMVENLWFMIMQSSFNKLWPKPEVAVPN
jgi:BASS family bile acid:Na+ symporter